MESGWKRQGRSSAEQPEMDNGLDDTDDGVIVEECTCTAPNPELRGGFRRETAVFHKAEADLALTVDALSVFRTSPGFLSIIYERKL